jgi:hypothetical protein
VKIITGFKTLKEAEKASDQFRSDGWAYLYAGPIGMYNGRKMLSLYMGQGNVALLDVNDPTNNPIDDELSLKNTFEYGYLQIDKKETFPWPE